MTAKKKTGGRVTPKGTQPTAATKGQGKPGAPAAGAPRELPGRIGPVQGRAAFGNVGGGKARSGHHGGNR